ncbi:MAG: undecaprenyl-diphosphate phosphatase [Candidatus Krumholzibacteriota bacterium]|nr:undecaprenyl-diphosphate phosphatase [Candidatus Krumholzibacteriota bacterium]
MSFEMINVLILAVIQGVTEFLPVSSSGHLVLAESILGSPVGRGQGSLMFEIAVHTGTLGAVIVIYRERARSLLSALFQWVSGAFKSDEGNIGELRYLVWILLGSLPAAVVGIFLRVHIVRFFDSPVLTSVCLLVTGFFLLFSRRRSGDSDLTWKIVLLIGAAQAVAILPGCSRSGWTITAALLAGVGFRKAAEFSFFLSIPAVLGALLLELINGEAVFTSMGVIYLLTGMIAAFGSGLLALRLLIYLLEKGRLYRFSWYLLPAATAALWYFIKTG